MVLSTLLFYFISSIQGIQRSNSVISTKLTHTSTFRVGNPRLMRKNTGPINRDHFWGFMSLRPAPPLKTQQLLCLRDVS